MNTAEPSNRIEAQRPVNTDETVSLFVRIGRLLSNPRRIRNAIWQRVLGGPKRIDWDLRASELGAYSVIDSRHSPDEYEYVTKRQKEIIYPLFLRTLNGRERLILDFGCGVGRFTSDLAKMIHGDAVGTDVTERLIGLCPEGTNVEYIHSLDFFCENDMYFDVIWVCLVLGGLPDEELSSLAQKMEKSLANDGLVFLIESTGEVFLDGVWRIRTREQLTSCFPSVRFDHLGTYHDVGQEISILAGRKLNNF